MQHLQPNTTLQGGKYKIERVLGQGGFGITYLATDIALDRKVAVKEFFPKDYCDRNGSTSHITIGTESAAEFVQKLKAKFLKEVRNIAKLDHPGIIRIHAAFEENNTAYYVMDYIEGENLAEMVQRNGPLPEQRAVAYIEKIGEALQYIHARHINHLDIKPANIMVRREDDRPILIDFGLSKQYDTDGQQTSTTPTGISHGYAPMEQYNDGGVKEFSPQTDIYSLAATLYFLLSGVIPPQATKLVDEELTFPQSIPANLIVAISKGMATSRKQRYDAVDKFLAELKASEEEDTIIECSTISNTKQVPPLPKEKAYSSKSFKRFRKWGVIVAIVIVVILVGSITILLYSATAQYKIGKLYSEGNWVSQNYEKAVKWYQKAAEQGDATAQNSLGTCYIYGNGVRQDYCEAVKWYQKAAEQGNATAQYNLGICYDIGRGVSQNYNEAVKWYKKAAEQGRADAQYNLGSCYYNGEGISQDYSEAANWYRKAAEQGYAKAQNTLGICYENGEGVIQDHSEAAKWYRKAADQGYAEAQYNLGSCYTNGEGVNQDYTEAAKWYRKAANQGNASAQYNLGVCYSNGHGVDQDNVEAVKWYRKAAEQGNADAQYNLGVCYENGEGVTQDFEKAAKWNRKAAEQGHKIARMWEDARINGQVNLKDYQ